MNYNMIILLVAFLISFPTTSPAISNKFQAITKLYENEDSFIAPERKTREPTPEDLSEKQQSADRRFISKKKTKTKEKKDTEEKVKEKEPPPEGEYEPVLVGALLEKPNSFIGKKVKFRGRFSSFTTLALDYGPALRKSKDYISLCIFRQDSNIPLSELKLAYPVKEAKEDPVIHELEEGDLLEIYGQVFSAALDEPWVDITFLKNIDGLKTDDKADKIKEKGDEDKDKRE